MAPFVLGVTGASAQPLAERAIELLLNNNHNIHLILSKGAYKVWKAEKDITIPIDPQKQEKFWKDRLSIKDNSGSLSCHRWDDNAACIASGSYITKGMLILPCTMGTVGRISSGVSLSLIERCADVHLKEKRKLVIAPREMPWNLLHLRNLTTLAEAGVQIAPPIPAWYSKPKNIEEMVDFITVRIFDIFGEELAEIKRWEGT